MDEEDYTLSKLEELDRLLAEIESNAHNARSNVIAAVRIKRELNSGRLPEEDAEVMELDLERKIEQIDYSLRELTDGVKTAQEVSE